MKPRKMEWSLLIAAITAVLDFLVGFGWKALTAENASWIIAAITAGAGIVVAVKTRPVAPGAFTYAIGVAAALLGSYGLHLSQSAVSSFSTAFVAVLAMLMRGQVAPTTDVKAGLVAPDGVTVLRALPPAPRQTASGHILD